MKNNLKTKIFKYLILFSIIILLLFWILNISSLGIFYETSKKKQLLNTVSQIQENYQSTSLEDMLDNLTYNNDLCVEVYRNNQPVYISNDYHRGCMVDGNPLELNVYKRAFMNSGYTNQNYEFINPKHNNKILMSSLKIDDTYIFINTSLEPIDSTVEVIKHQFIYILIAVLILSFIIAYFISKIISKPIEKINESAKKMAKGEFDVVFENDSNIEEIEELAKTLNYTRDELEKTELLRQELMANVSHDLKTPLTMIKAYAEMVRDLTYNDKNKRNANLNTIIDETDRLNILVNDILELSKMQTGQIPFIEEEFDIHTCIQDIIKRYDIYVTRDGYTIDYDNNKVIKVLADKKRIEQVIYNLLNNALNYTGDNKTVKIHLIDKKDTVRVEVVDTGKGIASEELNHIWDKYYKIDKTYSRVQIGSGIGLSIVKNILMRQNLPFGVNSSKRGSTFYFEIKKI